MAPLPPAPRPGGREAPPSWGVLRGYLRNSNPPLKEGFKAVYLFGTQTHTNTMHRKKKLKTKHRPEGRAPDIAEHEFLQKDCVEDAKIQTANCTQTGARMVCRNTGTGLDFYVCVCRGGSIAGVPAKI